MAYTGERIAHENCGRVYQMRQGRLTLIKLLNKVKSSLVDFLALSKLRIFLDFHVLALFHFFFWHFSNFSRERKLTTFKF